jgi:hypothetical protein
MTSTRRHSITAPPRLLDRAPEGDPARRARQFRETRDVREAREALDVREVRLMDGVMKSKLCKGPGRGIWCRADRPLRDFDRGSQMSPSVVVGCPPVP